MPEPSLEARFAGRMGQLLGPDFPGDLGLAVSGGGDSMALLHLAAGWARVWGLRLWPVTVDHGLRPESAAEAALVAEECRLLGLSHAILRWQGWDGTGNLQDAARQARLDLIGSWRGEPGHVLFGHTGDDQAETVLMRLRRGSGVEGLAGMSDRRRIGTGAASWAVVRPLLQESRSELRRYNRVMGIPFVDDPTNQDMAFDRVRMRRILGILETEGIGRETLTATAARMRRASQALAARARDVAGRVTLDGLHPAAVGSVVLARDPFAAVERDTQMRVLAAALQFVASAAYRPRASALEAALDRWLSGGTATLHGCLLLALGSRLWLCREPAALGGVEAAPGALWDGRWRLEGPAIAGLRVRALGADGLARVGREAAPDLPRQALLGLPALHGAEGLVACAALGYGPRHRVALLPPGGAFPDRLGAH